MTSRMVLPVTITDLRLPIVLRSTWGRMTVTPGTVVCESMTTSVECVQNEHLLEHATYLEQVYQDFGLFTRDYDLYPGSSFRYDIFHNIFQLSRTFIHFTLSCGAVASL